MSISNGGDQVTTLEPRPRVKTANGRRAYKIVL